LDAVGTARTEHSTWNPDRSRFHPFHLPVGTQGESLGRTLLGAGIDSVDLL